MICTWKNHPRIISSWLSAMPCIKLHQIYAVSSHPSGASVWQKLILAKRQCNWISHHISWIQFFNQSVEWKILNALAIIHLSNWGCFSFVWQWHLKLYRATCVSVQSWILQTIRYSISKYNGIAWKRRPCLDWV